MVTGLQFSAMRQDRLARTYKARALLGVGLCALSMMASRTAFAQQALPDIVVGRSKPHRVAANHPAPRAAPAPHRVVAQRSVPPTRTAATPAPAMNPGPTPFLAPGQQLGRGPTGVVGYVASGTSTATKTNTPILDIPQSVTIVTQQQLKDRDSVTLEQALDFVPGVTVAGGEGNSDEVVIRGQSTTADFYKDGVRDDAEYIRDLYNIQAVEVLKGPSALTFGRGGAGGIVNRVTKKADGETIRDLETSFGSFGRKRVTLDLGQAVFDQFAVRLNGLYEQSYGYRNYFGLERYGISPTATWKPDESTNVTLTYEHFRDRRTADRGINSLGLSSFVDGLPGSVASMFPGYPAPVPNWAFYGDANPSAAQTNYSKVDVNTVDLAAEHKTDFGLEIRNHVSFGNYEKRYQNTFTGEPIQFYEGAINGIGGYAHHTPRQNIIDQTDFVYKYQMTPEVAHTLAFGTEFGHQKSKSERDFACFNFDCATTEVDTYFAAPTIYNPINFGNLAERRRTDLLTASAYVQDQIAITKYLDVIAGVRYDRFDLKFTGSDYPTLGSAGGDGDQDEASGSVDAYIRRVDTGWSPRAGLVVKPTEKLSFYGAYSRSFLPASGDQFVLLTPDLAALAPQGVESYEIGFKNELMPRLFFTGALYLMNRSNLPAAVSSISSVAVNTRTRGGELGLVGQVTDKWQVSMGYGHQISLVTASNGAPDESDPMATFVGKKAPNVPLDTFSFWNKYDVSSLVDAGPGVLGVGLGVVYKAKFYPELDNAVIVPGYARVDGALFLKLTEKISARLNVENIAGAHYYASASGNNNIMPGAPRSAFVTLTAKF